jgi:hypothetical protein
LKLHGDASVEVINHFVFEGAKVHLSVLLV